MLAGVWTSWRLTATGLILGAAMHGVLRIPE
jgi:hypothetical protein